MPGPELIDSYSETNQDAEDLLDTAAGGKVEVGQAITMPGASYTLTSAKFYARNYNSATGNICARIKECSGTPGTNGDWTDTVLATSDSVDVSGWGTAYALRAFTFSGTSQITLNANTNYVVTIQRLTAGTAGKGIYVGRDDSSPTHAGNYTDSTPGSTIDECFYLYGEKIVVPGGNPMLFGGGVAIG